MGAVKRLHNTDGAIRVDRSVFAVVAIGGEAAGIGAGVRNWTPMRDGTWHLEDVWMSTERP